MRPVRPFGFSGSYGTRRRRGGGGHSVGFAAMQSGSAGIFAVTRTLRGLGIPTTIRGQPITRTSAKSRLIVIAESVAHVAQLIRSKSITESLGHQIRTARMHWTIW